MVDKKKKDAHHAQVAASSNEQATTSSFFAGKGRYWVDVIAIALFALIAFAYFMPADLDGRILYRHDASAGRGAGQELSEYYQKTGERTRWTNSTFSGMPTYQTAPSYDSTTVLGKVMSAYHLWLPENVWYVFAYLLGFYILLRAFDFRRELAILGSILWAFSSYFFIIIAAGHIWKVMALAYLPPMIAGIVLAYRGKYLWGLILTALFAAFEIKANHVQMTYYYLFIILFMVIAFLIDAIRKHEIARFVKATLVCLVAAALAVCMNLSNLYHTWQYAKESMRGKSELVKPNSENQTNSGLDRDYITQWSYGIDETWTLMIPNTKGGASVSMAANKIVQEQADPQFYQIFEQLGQYWGNQPGTSGPVYVGAFVCFLFILGLFIVKGPMKWALLAATILSILLSWGRNFMPFTNFFLDYIPMYAKFRTVASILVIAEFTIPLLAMMALKKLVDEPQLMQQKAKWLYASLGLTAGLCVLFALMPSVFFPDYISVAEQNALKQLPPESFDPICNEITRVRKAIFTADCWRSFWVIMIGFALLMLYKFKKLKASWMVVGILVLCLVDMWQVNKRYLYDDMFVEKSVRETPQEMSDTDKQILQDENLDYRVLNLAANTFNENETSYYHKSIGGYHAAKLRRYQELIDAYLMPEMQAMMPAIAQGQGDMSQVRGDTIWPIMNMLNARYIIMPLQGGQTIPLLNPYAQGNAWFVDRLTYVDNANQELDALKTLDLMHEAVADKRFADVLGQAKEQTGKPSATLTTYEPNKLTYKVQSDEGGVLVFSEIYYPGWTATVDGVDVPLGRVNYVLRALQIKAGEHEVVLSFFPKSISITETIAYIASAALLILFLLALFFYWKKSKKSTETTETKQ